MLKKYTRINNPGFLLVAALLILQGCSKKHVLPSGARVDTTYTIANIFQSNMVIQRDKPFAIWGKAAPAQKVAVKVSWDTQMYTSTTDAQGKWKVIIPPAAANSKAQTIKVTPDGRKSVSLTNVLIGDVWICSGQSNMVMPVGVDPDVAAFKGVADYANEINAANYPQIRAATVVQSMDAQPQDMLKAAAEWKVCSPATVGRFSAVSYFFARKLQTELNVPMGIIIAAVSGTNCQLWTNAGVFDNDAVLAKEYGAKHSHLYNGMINPLNQLAIKGFTWYQGESNWGDSPNSYAKLNAALIAGWRAQFNQGILPFYIVQVAPFDKNKDGYEAAYDYALFREGQAKVLNLAPGTGMAVTMDVGEALNLHPLNKKPIGERLALLALKNDYGKPVEASIPS
ncbi:MAG: sialate O-acetylesterase [Sphingobacteriales bacterium]|nr:MAG: sialate O-acetylesterase [Sphingobacteriales bacterium]